MRFLLSLFLGCLTILLSAQETLQCSFTLSGKLETISDEDGTLLRQYEYDDADRLIAGSTRNTRFERKYNAQGQLLEERWSNGLSLRKEYDAQGLLIAMHLPSGRSIHYTYLNGVLHAIAYDGYTCFLGPYDSEGRLLAEELPNNLGKVQRRYNPLGSETELITPYFTQKTTHNAQRYALSCSIDEDTEHYAYDAYGQLALPDYRFDAGQRRLDAQVSEDGKVLATDACVCSYDEHGRLASKEQGSSVTTYHYDALSQLIRVDTDTRHFHYVYDALGRRIAKITASKAPKGLVMEHQWFLYDDLWEIASFDRHGEQQALRILMQNNPLKPVMIEQADQLLIPLVDQKGATLAIVDSQGQVEKAPSISPFGRTAEPLLHPWAYHGQRFDPETGFYYFGRRYYDPELLTWTTPDPLGTFDSPNRYQFLHNNPFFYTDLDGQSSAIIQGLFAVLGEAAGAAIQAAVDLVVTGLVVEKVTEEVKDEKKEVKAPPYNGQELGDDPTKCPGEGFVWHGRGPPSSGRGSWHNEATGESLHPDLNHAEPIGPHWDYIKEGSRKIRLYPDGSWSYDD